jgi:hypothetical protein
MNHPDDEPCRGVLPDDYEPTEPDGPEYACTTCEDLGYVARYDNRDAETGADDCPWLADPERHPPSTPVPLATTMLGRVPGHDPECDGTCNYGYPNGCPPF